MIATLIVLLCYTYETHRIRKIYAQQRDLSLLPALMLYLRQRVNDKRLVIRNIGMGAATGVKILPEKLKVDRQTLEYRFNLLDSNDTLVPNEEREVNVSDYVDDEQSTSVDSSFIALHDPEISRSSKDTGEKKITISYRDIIGRPYNTVIVFSCKGITVDKPPIVEG